MKWFFLCIYSLSLFAAEEEIRVMGIGYCTIDLLVRVEDDFIERHIVSKRGGCQREEALDPIDDLLGLIESEPKIVPGGSAANTVRALSQLGQHCAFWGHVGQDHWGDRFTSHLHAYGIDPRLRHAPFTARVLCLISPDGQRTFLSCDPQVDSIPDKSDFQGVRWIHLEARYLFNRAVVERTVEIARELGIPISIDLSCCTTVQHFRNELLHLIENDVALLFCNGDEASVLLGLEPEAACFELQKKCPTAVVTLGKEGCLIGHDGKVVAVSSKPAILVDTTGAGDTFAAGFLYGYLRGFSLEECARIGHFLASAVIEVIGTELSFETWKTLREQILCSQR